LSNLVVSKAIAEKITKNPDSEKLTQEVAVLFLQLYTKILPALQ
jgi:hypothetical protein